MPQLSLYIDNDTLKRIETAAKMEHVSISKYVVKRLNESMDSKWPLGFEQLFGSIKDDTFCRQPENSFSADISREIL